MCEKAGADTVDTIGCGWGAAQPGVGRRVNTVSIWRSTSVSLYRPGAGGDNGDVGGVQAQRSGGPRETDDYPGVCAFIDLKWGTALNDVTLRPAIDRFVCFFVHAVEVKKKGAARDHHEPITDPPLSST